MRNIDGSFVISQFITHNMRVTCCSDALCVRNEPLFFIIESVCVFVAGGADCVVVKCSVVYVVVIVVVVVVAVFCCV